MFDINTILSQALDAAVQKAVEDALRRTVFDFATPLTQVQDQLATLAEKTAALAGQVQPTSEGMDLRALIKSELAELIKSDDSVRESLHNLAVAAADQAVSDHCDEYDHESYDEAASAIEDLDVDELVKSEDLQSEVKEILEGATFSVSF